MTLAEWNPETDPVKSSSPIHAQSIRLARGPGYLPDDPGPFYSDRTVPKDLKPGEKVEWAYQEDHQVHKDECVITQHTHCPFPVDLLPRCDSEAIPPPLFFGQFLRHDRFDRFGHKLGFREYVAIWIQCEEPQEHVFHLVWDLLNEHKTLLDSARKEIFIPIEPKELCSRTR